MSSKEKPRRKAKKAEEKIPKAKAPVRKVKAVKKPAKEVKKPAKKVAARKAPKVEVKQKVEPKPKEVKVKEEIKPKEISPKEVKPEEEIKPTKTEPEAPTLPPPKATVSVRYGTSIIARDARGFSLKEVREAGLELHRARRRGLYIDVRRQTNRPENVELLKTWLGSKAPMRTRKT